MKTEIGCENSDLFVEVITGDDQKRVYLNPELGSYALGILQPFLDRYLQDNGGDLDYIHGEDSLRELAEDGIGILLEPIRNESFFKDIILGGVYPRKTFSIGHANDKRYYMEARRIRSS